MRDGKDTDGQRRHSNGTAIRRAVGDRPDDLASQGISKLDEATLESIADEMGGSYLHVDASHTIEQAVSAKASRQWRPHQTVKRRERTIPVIWPFAVALGLLLAWEIGAWIAMSRRML